MTFVDLLHCCVRARWPLVRVLALLIPLLAASENSLAGNVNLAWDAVANATGYRLHYGTSSGNYSSSIDAKNQTTVTVFGLTDGTRYHFAVKAYDTTTTSDFSNEVSAVPASSPNPFPADTTPPARPQGLHIRVP
jgi:chitodextrinase